MTSPLQHANDAVMIRDDRGCAGGNYHRQDFTQRQQDGVPGRSIIKHCAEIDDETRDERADSA
jgi:hypothetical protein